MLLDALKQFIPEGKGYIFINRHGRIWGRSELRDMWLKLNIGATPHQLRHAYVTMLYEAGIDEEIAMTQTGHSNITTMRDIYTHIRNKKLNEAKDKINAYVKIS